MYVTRINRPSQGSVSFFVSNPKSLISGLFTSSFPVTSLCRAFASTGKRGNKC